MIFCDPLAAVKMLACILGLVNKALTEGHVKLHFADVVDG